MGPVTSLLYDCQNDEVLGRQCCELISMCWDQGNYLETPISAMKVAMRCRSSRLPQSWLSTGVWSGQSPILTGSHTGQGCSRCVVRLPVGLAQGHRSVWPAAELVGTADVACPNPKHSDLLPSGQQVVGGQPCCRCRCSCVHLLALRMVLTSGQLADLLFPPWPGDRTHNHVCGLKPRSRLGSLHDWMPPSGWAPDARYTIYGVQAGEICRQCSVLC